MGREAFRFMHATSLHLDEPIVGVGSLSGDDRPLAEDATLIAWDRVVEHCLQSQVDFLLLTGDAFAANAESLRARVSLEKGFEKLEAHKIPAYVVPGAIDPASAWKRWVHLPPNVTLLADEQAEPVTIKRQGRTLAHLFVVASPRTDETRWNGSGLAALGRQQGPFSIGVTPAGTQVQWRDGLPVTPDLPSEPAAAVKLVKAAIDGGVNYLALGDGPRRTINVRDGIAHAPGPAQALDLVHSGGCGASLVHVPASGAVRIDLLHAALIRFETVSLSFGDSADWNSIVDKMADAWRGLSSGNGEKLWMLSWHLRGTAAIFDELNSPAAQHELWELLEAELDDPIGFRRLHRLSLHHWHVREEFEDELLEEFEQVVAEEGVFLADELRQEALSLETFPHRYRQQLQDIVKSTPRKSLIAKARAIALAHLHVTGD